MSYLGLDDQAVLDVAAALERQLGPLQQVHGTISGHASGLSSSGFGRRLESLIADVSRLLPVLRTIESDVSSLVSKLRSQVADQQRHSGGIPQGLGGWIGGAFAALGGTTLLSGGSKVWNNVLKPSLQGVDALSQLHEDLKPGSHYSAIWRKVIQLDGNSDVLKYKKFDFLQKLYANKELSAANSFFQKTHIADVASVAGKVETAVDVGKGTFAVAHDVSTHEYGRAFNDSIDTLATGLKGGNPVTYLAGVDLSLVKKDVELAQQVHWSEGLPNPFGGDNLKTVYLAEAKDLPGQLWTNLKDVF